MGKHIKKRTFNHLSVVEAAKYTGVGLNSMYNAIHDKEITPDLIVWTIFVDKKPEIHKYLFLKQTLLNWKRNRDKFITTKQACSILNLSIKQILYRVHTGKLIPDKVKKTTKGRRGSYFEFFFLRSTLDNFTNVKTLNAFESEAALDDQNSSASHGLLDLICP